MWAMDPKTGSRRTQANLAHRTHYLCKSIELLHSYCSHLLKVAMATANKNLKPKTRAKPSPSVIDISH